MRDGKRERERESGAKTHLTNRMINDVKLTLEAARRLDGCPAGWPVRLAASDRNETQNVPQTRCRYQHAASTPLHVCVCVLPIATATLE